mmetsp:Transcript_76569/g.234413  ORF Transcript_76569/g.234413 Transcript_76569/m.234413 type:complete len:274 (-) Transcript_76569:605-1426(-)
MPRRMRSASPRVRLTCLFLTLSTVDLHSRCLTRMCRNRTCVGSSTFRRLAAGAEDAEDEAGPAPRQSRMATTEARDASCPTCPSHCTAASTRAPAAIRGRPALRRKTVETAVPLPIDWNNSLQTKANPWCSGSSCSTATSGVADRAAAPRSAPFRSRSPRDRVHRTTLATAPPSPDVDPAAPSAPPCGSSSSLSSSASGSGTACARASRTVSPFRSTAQHATSPRLATTRRPPSSSPTAAEQPSAHPGWRSANCASSSSKLSRMAVFNRSSTQ